MKKHFPIMDKKILKELKKKLSSALNGKILSLVLFGSRARGDFDNESDIDIAIIVKDLSREIRNQILAIVIDLEFKYCIPLSIIIFSDQDFKRLKRKERRIALDIEKEGIPL